VTGWNISYFPVSFHCKLASLCYVGIYFMDIPLGVMITMLVRKCTISCIGVTDCWVEIKSEHSSAFCGNSLAATQRRKSPCSFLDVVGSSKYNNWPTQLFHQKSYSGLQMSSCCKCVYSPKHISCRSFMPQLVTTGSIKEYNHK
jgi:hypothetical protein